MIKLLFVFFLTMFVVAGSYWFFKDNFTLKTAKIMLAILATAFVSVSVLTAITLLF
jgi:heme/copper-type cytochrome/quinol oxidase subunit 4